MNSGELLFTGGGVVVASGDLAGRGGTRGVMGDNTFSSSAAPVDIPKPGSGDTVYRRRLGQPVIDKYMSDLGDAIAGEPMPSEQRQQALAALVRLEKELRSDSPDPAALERAFGRLAQLGPNIAQTIGGLSAFIAEVQHT
jgi:hypothetical protein